MNLPVSVLSIRAKLKISVFCDTPIASSAKIEFFARGTFVALVDNNCIAGRAPTSLQIVLF